MPPQRQSRQLQTGNPSFSILRVCIQSTKRVVFPKPAGADMSVSLRANPSSMRLTKRDRVIQFDRSGGTHSFVLNGVRCWFSSRMTLISWGTPSHRKRFFVDDRVLKIPASFESSRNQRYQEFRRENKGYSATYHNF